MAGLRTACAGFTDARQSPDPDGNYSMADIGLSAFSLFFMQSESFLSHQRRLEQGYGTSNCHTLFGMKKIPTDNYIRLMLDPVWPEALQPCFDQVIEQLRERDGLQAFQRLGWANAGGAGWNGVFLFAKTELPAVPDAQALERQDGALSRHAGGDDRCSRPQHGAAADARVHHAAGWSREAGLRAQRRQTLAERARRATRCSRCARSIWATLCSVASRWPRRCWQPARIFCLCAKKTATRRCTNMSMARRWTERTVIERKPGKRSLTYRYRWIEAVPLRDGKGALNVNWLGVTITDETGKTTYDGAFVTSLPVTADNVVETRRLRTGPLEDRERELQRAEKQRLQFGTQLRTRKEIPGQNLRHHEPVGLRLPYRLRLPGITLATSP
jgi:hypothetical protein